MLFKLIFAFCLMPVLAFAGNGFYSANSSEALVKFNGHIEFTIGSNRITQDVVKSRVREQIFQSIGPLRREAHSASFHPDFQIRLLKSERWGPTARVDYEFSGKMAVHDLVGETLPIVLTRNPARAFQKGWRSCTTKHDSLPFWYYWDPKLEGCQLKEGSDYFVVQAQVDKLKNVEAAYPEYQRLVRDGVIDVRAFFGPYDRFSGSFDIENSEDLGVKEFRRFRKFLRAEGYSLRRLSLEEVRKVYPHASVDSPVVEEAVLKTSKAEIRVQIFFGQPFVINFFNNTAFQKFFIKALKEASVVLYSGHAGQGYNLHEGALEWRYAQTIKPPHHRYQIFHFATCLGYTYYDQMYFDWKRTESDLTGTQDLDFLAYSGGETLFKKMSRDLANTLKAIQLWAKGEQVLSYQEMAAQIESEPFLFYASGISDNPKSPDGL